jgi:hypothetical protein
MKVREGKYTHGSLSDRNTLLIGQENGLKFMLQETLLSIFWKYKSFQTVRHFYGTLYISKVSSACLRFLCILHPLNVLDPAFYENQVQELPTNS